MKYGLSEAEVGYLYQIVVAPLKEAGASVFIFGSRARGQFQKFSDIDILVQINSDLSHLISEITERLENSNFPYKVDIVDSSALAPSYLKNVDLDKILL